MESNTWTEKILFRRVRKITKSPRNGFKGGLINSKISRSHNFSSKNLTQKEYIEGYLCSFIEGAVAKDFFLKSKLPNDELIHIWELSDIDRDGRLTKLEFSLAFHFTSARRNNFPLPEQIPNQLYNDLIGKMKISNWIKFHFCFI